MGVIIIWVMVYMDCGQKDYYLNMEITIPRCVHAAEKISKLKKIWFPHWESHLCGGFTLLIEMLSVVLRISTWSWPSHLAYQAPDSSEAASLTP